MKLRRSYGNILKTYVPAKWKMKKKETNFLTHVTHQQGILHSTSMTFFIKVENSILKFIWKHKIPGIDKTILSKNSNAGGTTIPDFKLYSRVRVIKQHSTDTKHI
jgi:hypothetical protein